MTNREIPVIIQGFIPPVNQTTADGVEKIGRDLHAVCAVLHKEVIMGATCNAAGILKDPPVLNWKDMGGTIKVDINTFGILPRTTTTVWTGTGPFSPPICIGIQKIEGPRRSIIPLEARNANPLDASIN